MMKTLVGGAAVLAGAMLFSAPAQAATWTFNQYNTATSGTLGNSIASPVSGGINMTATAWSTAGLSVSDLPTVAYLGDYGNAGFGVTNSTEGDGRSQNAHTIDNYLKYDFVKLEFSSAVKLTGITLNGYDVLGNGTIDTDTWVSYGNAGFANTTDWQTYLTNGTNVASGSNYVTTNYAKVWLIGAARTSTDRNDGFKLASITAVNAPAVPEPATWGMMILGFGVIGGAMRRRTKAAIRFA